MIFISSLENLKNPSRNICNYQKQVLRLSFNKSRSKYFNDAVVIASTFSGFSYSDNCVTVDLTMKDIFERWQYFNNLFWTVVDWQGSALEYEGLKYFSHCDKTRLFYALQDAHTKWIGLMAQKLSGSHKVYTGDITMEQLEEQVINDESINRLIDSFFPNKL